MKLAQDESTFILYQKKLRYILKPYSFRQQESISYCAHAHSWNRPSAYSGSAVSGLVNESTGRCGSLVVHKYCEIPLEKTPLRPVLCVHNMEVFQGLPVCFVGVVLHNKAV